MRILNFLMTVKAKGQPLKKQSIDKISLLNGFLVYQHNSQRWTCNNLLLIKSFVIKVENVPRWLRRQTEKKRAEQCKKRKIKKFSTFTLLLSSIAAEYSPLIFCININPEIIENFHCKKICVFGREAGWFLCGCLLVCSKCLGEMFANKCISYK